MDLNRRAFDICGQMVKASGELRIATHKLRGGTLVIDCGVDKAGGLEAGRLLAECCLAGLGSVRLGAGPDRLWSGPFVHVATDQPIAACLAAQYAGWEVKTEKYFAMGSGPMRAAANREAIYETIGFAEHADVAVGILETRAMPSSAVATQLAEACGVAEEDLVLLVAPTASQAGNLQIAARSVETAMHKLHELEFDLERIESGYGVAPLPPIAGDDLSAIGRTNDAILYGAQVVLWVRGDDESLQQIGPQVPSDSSSDYGQPFASIFARYDHDFYKIDRLLFSPAVVTLNNLDTGHCFRFGKLAVDVLKESFAVTDASG